MPYDPNRHHRRSVRLRDYDYSSAGLYYLTICTHNREPLFGHVDGDQMHLTAFGEIADEEWHRSAQIRSEIDLDIWVVMPNHLHGIVIINDSNVQGVRPHAPTPRSMGGIPRSLSSFVTGFKSAVKLRINEVRDAHGTPVWQRSFYDHVIAHERELNAIREYIDLNPMRWSLDEHNPAR